MITFARKDGKALCSVEIYIPTLGNRVFDFEWQCGGEYSAGLLYGAMREQLSEALETARREAYSQGWRDAKAKRAKERWFSGSW